MINKMVAQNYFWFPFISYEYDYEELKADSYNQFLKDRTRMNFSNWKKFDQLILEEWIEHHLNILSLILT